MQNEAAILAKTHFSTIQLSMCVREKCDDLLEFMSIFNPIHYFIPLSKVLYWYELRLNEEDRHNYIYDAMEGMNRSGFCTRAKNEQDFGCHYYNKEDDMYFSLKGMARWNEEQNMDTEIARNIKVVVKILYDIYVGLLEKRYGLLLLNTIVTENGVAM
jgi:hypothetical protein